MKGEQIWGEITGDGGKVGRAESTVLSIGFTFYQLQADLGEAGANPILGRAARAIGEQERNSVGGRSRRRDE